MKKKFRKIMTINDLAIMTQNGFAALSKEMNEGFAAVSKEMNERFEAVDRRFDRLEAKFDAHDRRIENLEDKARIVNTKLGLA